MEKYKFSSIEKKILEESCIPYAIYQLIDHRVVTLIVSEGFCSLFGITRSKAYEILDSDMYRSAHPDDAARIANSAYRFASDDEEFDEVYRTKTGKSSDYIIVHSCGSNITLSDGTKVSVVWYVSEDTYSGNDDVITKKLKKEIQDVLYKESLIRENYYDMLTGLPNMSYFLRLADSWKKEIIKEKRIPTMLYFDLIGMKYFNDKYGLSEGDKLLRELAFLLKKYFSNENCCRLGQDHFAAYTCVENITEILDEIFDKLKSLNNGNTLPLRVGIYRDIFEPIAASAAIDRAKLACDEDRSRVASWYNFYDSRLRSKFLQREYIINNYQRAMDEGWIKPFYQPIIRTINGRVCDEEALARWVDPARGIISPEIFIPVLEDAKLIHHVDLRIIEKVLENLKLREKMNIQPVPVSINLSRYDFQLCDIIDEICKRVDASGVSRDMITLEITESVADVDSNHLKEQIRKLHDAGFKVWMDDFGSGYSSLNILQEFDFDLIKFDMKFMREFDTAYKNHIILTEIMRMATKLRIDTVTEGVETKEQVSFLKEIGCDKIQGFYFSKPMPFEMIAEYYQNGIGIEIENHDETNYFETVSRTNLNDPTVNEDYRSEVSEYFSVVPMGILEVENDDFYVIRHNKTYMNFLVKTNFIEEDQISEKRNKLKRKPESNFIDIVNKTIASGEWETLVNSHENGYEINSFVRKIAVNPKTGAYAIIVIILSVM